MRMTRELDRRPPRIRAIVLCLAVVCLLTSVGYAMDGDITHVVSHDHVFVVTDPSDGTNSYSQWAVFPPDPANYRTITLWITYACPDGLHCGEWDYIDQIMLRRTGGNAGPVRNIELARMISPYGWRFDSEWKFTWHTDITDFAFLLRDSVEIEFVHTGYENNTDRGWVITLDFEITHGRPAMTCLGMDTLWCGSFPYGDTTRDIEQLLAPISFTAPAEADIARLRIHQTGHGMDDSANCAEFCRKWRHVYFGDSLINTRDLWRKCGDNPLYPQAGTWIFDRANWCPGAVVYPDIYDLSLDDDGPHSVDLAMEPYVNPNQPSANWFIHSYLFYYTKPWAMHDVAVEHIVTPSTLDEYSRRNPACAQPAFVMKNNGSATIESVTIHYGVHGGDEYLHAWSGVLPSQASTEIALPGPITASLEPKEFFVRLESPNGAEDEYPADNMAISRSSAVPLYPAQLVLAVRTNNDSSQTSYRVTEADGSIIHECLPASLDVATTYYDTLSLEPGCYHLLVGDTAGDGLDFWFNTEGGRGYVRLLDVNGRLVKAFPSDFGSSIDHWFMADPEISSDTRGAAQAIVQPFPPRNAGTFEVDLFFNQPTDITLRVLTEDSAQTVFHQQLDAFKDGFVPVDISAEPDGIYWLKADLGADTVTHRIRVKR
jgi:hypothetical protein